MDNIEKLQQQAVHDKIQQGIKARGYQCVTFISDGNITQHPYHYTVGLSAMGFAEIFISGRLPSEVAYAFIDKMVARWKEEKAVVLGKFGPFRRLIEKAAHKMVSRKVTLVGNFPAVAQQRNGTFVPMAVVWVSTDERRQNDPEFMAYLYATYPDNPNIPVVQLLWPDDHMRLPDAPNYTTDVEYLQERLLVKR